MERTTTRIETPNGTAVLRGPRDGHGHGRPPHPPPRPIYIPIVTSRHSQEERDGLGWGWFALQHLWDFQMATAVPSAFTQ